MGDRADGGIPLNESFLRWASAATKTLAIGVLALGILVLIGWIAGSPALTSLSPENVTMKANVAIAFCVAGGAIFFSCLAPERARSVVIVGGAFIFLLGAATLGEHLFNWNLGIDELLFEERLVPGTANAEQSDAPGRMAVSSAFCLALAGISLVGLYGRSARATLVQAPAVAIFFLGLLSLLSYFYGVPSFRGAVSYNPMAAHTAAGLVALGAALLLAQPDVGAMRVLSTDAFGGLTARRLLPTLLLVPPLIGVLRLIGERADLYPSAFGTTLFVVVMIAILLMVVWAISIRLNRLDLERQVAERELERRNQEQRAFVAAASHELRTPLTSVMGYLEVLSDPDSGPLSDSQQNVLSVIRRNSQRLYGLVDSLMLLFRTEQRSDLEIVELDLVSVAREAVQSAGPAARAKNIELEFSPRGEVIVRAQEQYIAQAVDNLLSNAIKFTPEGGRVQVTVFSEDGRGHCAVTDTGIGISAADQERLFEKFFRSQAATSVGGTGLGLSIAQAIAHAHGGWIAVESSEGKGSTFDLVLPERGTAS